MARFRVVARLKRTLGAKIKAAKDQRGYWVTQTEFLNLTEAQDYLKSIRDRFDEDVSLGICPVDWKPAVVFFDLDSTVIEQESMVVLARHAGCEKAIANLTDKAMSGKMDFVESLQERVALLEGLPQNILAKVVQELTLAPGIMEFTTYLRQQQIPYYLLSGGFVQIAGAISAKIGSKGFQANSLGVEHGKLSGKVVGTIVDAAEKRRWAEETASHFRVPLSHCMAVGDGANDLPLLDHVGLAIGYRPRKVLWPVVHMCNFDSHEMMISLLDDGQ